ncbi:MAG: hypothetical protein DCC58_18320 [Chloroflexi bacterium]|nr:MAG: hypothetical protein DCC58_18320 [Chloroflexota bacterium]
MAIKAMIHILNEETVVGDLDSMPDPTHAYIIVRNLRRRDNKPLPMIDSAATSFAFPWTRISFVEFFEEATTRENIVGFFRESDTQRRHG